MSRDNFKIAVRALADREGLTYMQARARLINDQSLAEDGALVSSPTGQHPDGPDPNGDDSAAGPVPAPESSI